MQLVLDNLTCDRGARTVFSGVSARIAAGEGLRVTGPNGAGKTSLLRLIAGLLTPAEGRVRLEGAPDDEPAGTHCHFLGHADGVKRALTVAENARFWAGYLGGGGAEAQRQALETFGLAALAGIPAGMLSAGQARRLALARLALAPRPVWLLDEPDAALDAAARDLLGRAMQRHLDDGGILVAASHTGLGVTFAGELALGGGPP